MSYTRTPGAAGSSSVAGPSNPPTFTPPSGSLMHPSSVLSNTAGTPTPGTFAANYHDVGSTAMSIDLLGVYCSVAQVAGATTMTLAVYPDDGTGSKPLLTGGPLLSGAVGVLKVDRVSDDHTATTVKLISTAAVPYSVTSG